MDEEFLMALSLREAWEFAREFFKNPNNQKLSRSNSKRGKKENQLEGLEQSFIRITRLVDKSSKSSSEPGCSSPNEAPYRIYMIKPGQKTIPEDKKGTFGHLKEIVDETDKSSYAKVQSFKQYTLETLLLQKLGYSSGEMIRRDITKGVWPKQYIQMEHLGDALDTYLGFSSQSNSGIYLKIAIELCWKIYQLHCLGYTHLDIKPSNTTIEADYRIHVVDYGTAKKNPDARIYLSMGTYWYRPRENHQLTGRLLDTTAILRAIVLGLIFQGAEKIYQFSTFKTSILNQIIIDKYNLNSLFNTDLYHRPTLKSFMDNHVELLSLHAILIDRLYQLQLGDDELKTNPKLAYLVSIMYWDGLSREEIKENLQDPDHYIKRTLPHEFKDLAPSVTQKLFFARHLQPGIDLHQLAGSKEQQFAFNRLEARGLLRHLPRVLSSPALLKLFSDINTANNIIRALEFILDEVPADANAYLQSRVEFLIDNQSMAAMIYPETEQALWLINQYQIPVTLEAVMADRDLAHLINCLPGFNLLPYFQEIQQIPGLKEKFICDAIPFDFMDCIQSILIEKSNTPNAAIYKRALYERQDLILAYASQMLPKRLNLTFFINCSNEDCIAIRAILHCRLDLIGDYHLMYNNIFTCSALQNFGLIENKIAVLVKSGSKRVEQWLLTISQRGLENTELYIPAFNLLVQRRSSGHIFDEVIMNLTEYSKTENLYALLALVRYRQLNKTNLNLLLKYPELVDSITSSPSSTVQQCLSCAEEETRHYAIKKVIKDSIKELKMKEPQIPTVLPSSSFWTPSQNTAAPHPTSSSMPEGSGVTSPALL